MTKYRKSMAMVFGIAGVISLLTPHMVYANSNGWVKKTVAGIMWKTIHLYRVGNG